MKVYYDHDCDVIKLGGLNGSSEDDDDELNVNTESNTHSNNDKDHTKSDTATNNITLMPVEAKLTKQQQRGHPAPLLQQTEQGGPRNPKEATTQ